MPSKNDKRVKIQKSRGLEVDTEAARILRTVGDHEAFYFYEDFGKPTGQIARSLSEFLEKIKSVKSESLRFHLQRKDFQNWVKKTLGDSKLARRIGRIPPSGDDDVRMKIQATIENRINEIREAPTMLLIEEDLAVPSSGSTS